MKQTIKAALAGGLYLFCNYFIANIPSWIIRKFFYRLCGMKIGKHSRIMMKTIVTIPWKIQIGDNTYINEHCFLDGRGGLSIGNNVNVSIFSMLITGSHDYRVKDFKYYTEPILIEDDVWIGARGIVLNGCNLKKGSIIGAGSVVTPRVVCNENTIYHGVPAQMKKSVGHDIDYDYLVWKVFFR